MCRLYASRIAEFLVVYYSDYCPHQMFLHIWVYHLSHQLKLLGPEGPGHQRSRFLHLFPLRPQLLRQLVSEHSVGVPQVLLLAIAAETWNEHLDLLQYALVLFDSLANIGHVTSPFGCKMNGSDDKSIVSVSKNAHTLERSP